MNKVKNNTGSNHLFGGHQEVLKESELGRVGFSHRMQPVLARQGSSLRSDEWAKIARP